MTQISKHLLWFVILLAGCTSVSKGPVPLPQAAEAPAEQEKVKQAAYTDIMPEITQPESVLADQGSRVSSSLLRLNRSQTMD